MAASMLVIFSAMSSSATVEDYFWLLLVVLSIFLIWLITSLALNRLESASTYVRVLVFFQMGALLVAVLAASVSGSIDENAGVGALAVVFFTMAALVHHVARTQGTSSALQKRAGLGATILGALLAINAFTPQTFNYGVLIAVFLALVLGYLFVLLPRIDRAWPIDREHLAERLGQLLLIMMGETFFEVVLAYKAGKEAHLFGFALVIVILALTWALYFDSVWTSGRPASSRALVTWILGHGLAVAGIGMASIGLSKIAVRSQGNALEFLTDASLIYALTITYAGLAVVAWSVTPPQRRLSVVLTLTAVALIIFGFSEPLHMAVEAEAQGAVVAVILLLSVILSSRTLRRRKVVTAP
jgi:low temperature requirement protein LtrA